MKLSKKLKKKLEKLSPNARTNIAWTVAISATVGLTYVLGTLGAPGWVVGGGGASSLIGTMMYAQHKKWIPKA